MRRASVVGKINWWQIRRFGAIELVNPAVRVDTERGTSIVQQCASSGSTIKAVQLPPSNSQFLLHSTLCHISFIQVLIHDDKMILTKCVRWLGDLNCAYRVKSHNSASSPNPNNVLLLFLRCLMSLLLYSVNVAPMNRACMKTSIKIYSRGIIITPCILLFRYPYGTKQTPNHALPSSEEAA